MANSISLTGKNSFVATDTSINKELFNFSINLNNSITSEAVLSGEVNLVNDTPVVINQKTPGIGHYIYVEVVDDPSNVGVTMMYGSTPISTMYLGEIMFLKLRNTSDIKLKQNVTGAQSTTAKYFLIEW